MITESQLYNCFTGNGGNAVPKHAGPEAKGSNPTNGRTLCSGPVAHSEKILTTGESHRKKPDSTQCNETLLPNW